MGKKHKKQEKDKKMSRESTKKKIMDLVKPSDPDYPTLRDYVRFSTVLDIEDAKDCMDYDQLMMEEEEEYENDMLKKGYCKCSHCSQFFPKGNYKGKKFKCYECRRF